MAARRRRVIWTEQARNALNGEDATHRFARPEFATDGKRFFFTLAAWESDVYVAELKR